MTEARPEPETSEEIPRKPIPFNTIELRRSLWSPPRMLEVVLAERGRLVASVSANRHLPSLVLVMLASSVLFALPYGAVADPGRFWDVAVLYLGSLVICFPCLQVFSAYLGVRIGVAQNLVLALTVTAAAALFCFGFFPIYWFLDATMESEAALVTPEHISVGLLTVSLVAGISQLNRCLFLDQALRKLQSNPILLLLWQGLLVFITYRMATVLGIL